MKKGTKQHEDDWDTTSKIWEHVVLHLLHDDGDFGVTFNDITVVLRMLLFILLRHVLWFGLVSFPRNVRVCGCPRR